MARHLVIRHVTTYKYAEPVRFGRHRMMFRPRDSHTLRLVDATLAIRPKPQNVRWAYDVFGNSVAYADFGDIAADALHFVSEIGVLHYEASAPTHLLAATAQSYPFQYPEDELPDLEPVMKMHSGDHTSSVIDWASKTARGKTAPLELLTALMSDIRNSIAYRRRTTMGTQSPAETLESRSGTCRDFAWLMIEALRSLGFAARFVSGYIFNPNRSTHQGGGATHAWVQVYLPGCGWIEMDPTNGIFGNRDLVRIAVVRHPAQAKPLSGAFTGKRSAYQGMEISVSVTDKAIPANAPPAFDERMENRTSR